MVWVFNFTAPSSVSELLNTAIPFSFMAFALSSYLEELLNYFTMSYYNNITFLDSLERDEMRSNQTLLFTVLLAGLLIATSTAIYFHAQHQTVLAQIRALKANQSPEDQSPMAG